MAEKTNQGKVTLPSSKKKLKLWLSVLFFLGSGGVFLLMCVYLLQSRSAYHKSVSDPEIISFDNIKSQNFNVKSGAALMFALKDHYELSDQDRKQLHYNLSQCLQGFYAADDITKKSQFVYKGEKMIPMMIKHYNSENFEFIRGTMKGIKAISVGKKDGLPMVDVVLNIDGAQDLEIPMIKDEADGSWKIDWPHFARYQSGSWSDFFAGQGNDIASFRVYAMRNLANEDNEHYGITLYKAKPNGVEVSNQLAPPVTVAKKSAAGEMFYQCLKLDELTKSDKSRVFESQDPSGWVRMQCKLIRIPDPKNPNQFLFKLYEVENMGWSGAHEKPEELIID